MPNNTNKLERFLFRRGGKYLLLGISISIIHAVFLIFFYMCGIFSMMLFNVFSIAGYLLFSAEAYRGNRIKEFFFFSVLELPLHAVIATLVVGSNYHFLFSMIASIPMIFYFVLFIGNFKHTIIIPTVITGLYGVLFIVFQAYSERTYPIIYVKNSDSYGAFFTSFNFTTIILSTILFNVLTSIEYNYIKNKLVSENSKLDTFATYDPLTNLLNRRSTDAALAHLYDVHYHDEDSFSIIMCDIDKFKNVNDTYGHDAGDYVLKEVAWIIKDQARENDVVGRWGGEEFLIVVSGNKASAATLAERIRAKIEEHTYTYKNYTLKVTITLGVSSFHANSDIKALIKSADQKLYRGKENGRNQVVS